MNKSMKNHFLKSTKLVFILTLALCTLSAFSQEKRVLFIGNSYTAVNNLPNIFQEVVESTGDTVFCKQNSPGGYRFQDHVYNSTTNRLLREGNWGYVVLQEQSQLPSFPIQQVQQEVFPYARALDSLINHFNGPCVETVFYMTWGRKNGDQQNCPVWPPVCTYEGMDSLLNLRYMMMGYDNNAIVSPVGAVWKYIRTKHPEIELYSSDGSHPSPEGSYAAACTFYSTIFRKDPANITYNFSLDEYTANKIKNAVKNVVYFNQQRWYIGKYDSIMQINCDPHINIPKFQESKIQVFPNPATNIININLNQNAPNMPMYLYSNEGVLVKRTICNSSTATIDLSSLPKGVYILKLGDFNPIRKKIVKI